MSDREPEQSTLKETQHLDAEAVRQLGLARGLEWTSDQAAAIRDLLVSTHESLRIAEARIDAQAEEPASGFQPDREA
jgi:hypothetical protein